MNMRKLIKITAFLLAFSITNAQQPEEFNQPPESPTAAAPAQPTESGKDLQQTEPLEIHTILQEKMVETKPEPFSKKNQSRKKRTGKLINFYFDNEDLIDIINYLAGLKEVNVVLPMGANAINAKITLHIEDKITLNEAWDILYTLLDLSGYSMIAQETMFRIVKTSKDVIREPMPLYIVKPDDIPNTDKRIRYIYYFNNIKVNEDPNNEMLVLLKDVLPDLAAYRLDPLTNSLLLIDKANNIKALMKIVSALDEAEAQEKPEIIRLRYLSADFVKNLFEEQILKATADNAPLRPGARTSSPASYFSKRLRLVADMRNNSLIVFGKPQAVERVRDFISKYIDVELESGKSILHTYQLQYLDAQKFEPVLRAIVESSRPGGTEQSKSGAVAGTTERFFDGVIIKADFPRTVSGEQAGGAMLGSNNLVIAARNDDWDRIKKLIEELDTPQPQVIIEVLIADLSLMDQRALGMSMRNPLGTCLANNVNFQSAQITPVIVNSVGIPPGPATIAGDLLRRGFDAATGAETSACDTAPLPNSCVSVLPSFAQGTAVASFNDPGTGQTWGIAQVRKFVDNKRILSHPHLITTNNKKAEFLIKEERLLVDEGSGSTGGTTTQTRKWIPAALNITITPRISAGNVVNLNVSIDINEFASLLNLGANNAVSGDRLTRNVTTNANVASGNVLALGGLTQTNTAASQNEVPLLGRIPLIGWMFKNRNSEVDRNNLTVFISPIIIEPRLRAGVGQYTKEYVQLAKNYAREGMLFDSLRDPITRWFFKPQSVDAEVPLDEFISQDELMAPTIFDTRTEQRRYTKADDPKNKSSENKSDDLKSIVNKLDENPFIKVMA